MKDIDIYKIDILYVIEFGIPLKLVRLIKMCVRETYSRVRVDKRLSDKFPVKSGLRKGNVLLL